MKRTVPLLLALTVASCTARPAPSAPAAAPAASAEELVDHEGDSITTAVPVPADAPDGGAEFENEWMLARYGRFTRRASGTGTAEGRRYNVVKIVLESGEQKSVYFDITENWQRELEHDQ